MIICALMLAQIFTQTAGSVAKTAAEDDIREAVFRYQFDHDAPQQKPITKVHFISVESKQDPDNKFLRRFAGNEPVVKQASQSRFSDNGVDSVIDKTTGEAGIIFSVGKVNWINENEAEIKASYYVANLFAGGCNYKVVRQDEKWIVKGCLGNIWES